jgi:hypothetical protein
MSIADLKGEFHAHKHTATVKSRLIDVIIGDLECDIVRPSIEMTRTHGTHASSFISSKHAKPSSPVAWILVGTGVWNKDSCGPFNKYCKRLAHEVESVEMSLSVTGARNRCGTTSTQVIDATAQVFPCLERSGCLLRIMKGTCQHVSQFGERLLGR